MVAKKFQRCVILISLFVSASGSGLNISTDYESFLRPNHGAIADFCNVSVRTLTIREINANHNMEMTLDFILTKGWTDPRLQNLVKKDTTFVSDFPHNIWMPDLYIVNAISLRRPEETGRSFRLKPEGEISIDERLVARVHCPKMSFIKFPFEKLVCHVKLQSYAYNTLNLDLLWNGIISDSEVQVADSHYHLISVVQTFSKEHINNGQFRTLGIQITVRRCGIAFVTSVILPTAVLMFISYLTLRFKCQSTIKSTSEINGEAPKPDRTNNFNLGLCVSGLAFLACIFIAQSVLIKSPTSSTITGLDVWTSVINLIALIIFLYNLSAFISQNNSKQQLLQSEQSTTLNDKFNNWLSKGIPVFFVLFCVIYFAVYLS